MCGSRWAMRPGVYPDPPAHRLAGRPVEAQQPAQLLDRVVGSERLVDPHEVALDGVRERLGHQVVLGAEVVEDQRRAHAELGGDVAHPDRGQSEPVHEVDGRGEDLLASYVDGTSRPTGHARSIERRKP